MDLSAHAAAFAAWALVAFASAAGEGAMPPLHQAAYNGSLQAITQLLDRGANIDAEDAAGNTALGVALFWRRLEVAQLLRRRGAAPFATGPQGKRLLPIPCAAGPLLEADLELLPRRIAPFEPLYLWIRWRNTDRRPHAVPLSFFFMGSERHLSVWAPDGRPLTIGRIETFGGGVVTLAPGACAEAVANLAESVTFSEPGTYLVQADLGWPTAIGSDVETGETLASEGHCASRWRWRVTVADPQAPEDIRALAVLRSVRSRMEAPFTWDRLLEAARDKLTALPANRWSDVARLHALRMRRSERPATEVLRLGEEYISVVTDPWVRPQLLAQVARIHHERGDFAGARRIAGLGVDGTVQPSDSILRQILDAANVRTTAHAPR